MRQADIVYHLKKHLSLIQSLEPAASLQRDRGAIKLDPGCAFGNVRLGGAANSQALPVNT